MASTKKAKKVVAKKKTVKKKPVAKKVPAKKMGILISFEGPECSGKTTQINRLATKLGDMKYDVVVTREPGGTPIGEEIRYMLKHGHSSANMFPETELLLFAASRAQLVRELILPALDDGKIILCDRFLDSTTVYQGAARQLSNDPVQKINTFSACELMPQLTLILDIPPEVSMHRIKYRANNIPDRMEEESIEFYKRVREGYLVLAKSIPGRFHLIDATKERKDIEKSIWTTVQKCFL